MRSRSRGRAALGFVSSERCDAWCWYTKITIWDRVPLGIEVADPDGLDTMEENLMVEVPSSIKALGQQIVAEEVSKQSM